MNKCRYVESDFISGQFSIGPPGIKLFHETLGVTYRRILAAPPRANQGLSPAEAERSILQLIYVPIVSAHWVTKYPGTGLRTLTAVVTACNDRRYRQFHRIRPRVSCVCMGAACGVVRSIERNGEEDRRDIRTRKGSR